LTHDKPTKIYHILTTLNRIFSVTYYLELCNAIIVYCASHVFTNYGRIGCLDIKSINIFTW